MFCAHCNSEMIPDYDYQNRVRVAVCSDPTCLHREYPDYPRRNGDQEICHACSKVFTLSKDVYGIICPECKRAMSESKAGSSGKRKTVRRRRVLTQVCI
jgi:hypothetical protein